MSYRRQRARKRKRKHRDQGRIDGRRGINQVEHLYRAYLTRKVQDERRQYLEGYWEGRKLS